MLHKRAACTRGDVDAQVSECLVGCGASARQVSGCHTNCLEDEFASLDGLENDDLGAADPLSDVPFAGPHAKLRPILQHESLWTFQVLDALMDLAASTLTEGPDQLTL